MLWKKEASWDLYYTFEDIIHNGSDVAIKKLLDQFDIYDFLSIPIVFDLVNYKQIRLLKLLRNKNVPLYYQEKYGENAIHVACGAGGNLEAVKFFVENSILTDVHKKSSKYGDTPLNLALTYEHEDILEYLKQKFHINSISFDDLNVIIDRIKSNCRKRDKNKEHKYNE